MFSKIFEAIASFFSTLFGGGSQPQPQPPSQPTPTEQPSRPAEDEPLPPAEAEIPQDGAEIKPDTIVVVAHELEKVVVVSDEKDKDDTPTDEEIPTPEPMPTPTTPEPPTQRYLWCLDNGHGKKTPGKRSPLFDDGKTRLLEYEFNRDIVKRIKEKLDEKKIAYFITVPEVDIDDFLVGRVNRANSKKSNLPKIFVSVHANAAPTASASGWSADNISGIETWFYHGSKKGQKIASIFQQHLVEKTGWRNRHLKSRPDKQFYVLRETTMPAVLTENGFYTNKKEAALLMTNEYRQKIADAHVAAIMEIEKNGL